MNDTLQTIIIAVVTLGGNHEVIEVEKNTPSRMGPG